MKLNDAKDIRLGNTQVKAVYLGEQLIWPQKQPEPSEPPLPDGYTRLLAIESTNSSPNSPLQLLTLQNTSKIVADYEITVEPTHMNYCVFCTNAEAWMWRVNALFRLSNSIKSRLSVFNSSGKSVVTEGEPVKIGVRYLVTAEGNYCEFVPLDPNETTIRIESPHTLNIQRQSGIVINSYGMQTSDWSEGVRYYSLKHYVDGELQNDFVPVLYEINNEMRIGMYDRITKTPSPFNKNGWNPIYL